MRLAEIRPGSTVTRWVLTIAVVLAPIGWGIGVAISLSGHRVGDLVGSFVVCVCVLVAIWHSAFRSRPLYPAGGPPIDEREIDLQRLAVIKGFAVVSMPSPLIFSYMGLALEYGWWTPSSHDWSGLLMVQLCWIFGMPLTFANWSVGKPLDDEDDQ